MPNLHWDDVNEGDSIPPLVKHPTTRQLVRYAGVSGDFYEIHYDDAFAKGTGLSGVILHGALKSAFLAQMLTDWIGPAGTLRKLGCQYRGMDIPGVALTCSGTVTKKYRADDGAALLDLDVWIEDEAGRRFTPGWATVELPEQ